MVEGIKLFILDIAIRGLLLLVAFSGLLLYNHGNTINDKNQLLEILPPYEVGYIFVFLLLFMEKLFYYIKHWKYITMPYRLKLLSQPKNQNKETTVFLDRFVKFDKDNHIAYFKNHNAIDRELYQNKKEQIIHYLGLYDKPVELEIKPTQSSLVALHFYHLGLFLEYDISYLKKEHLFYGLYKGGRYFLNINQQTHMITVGESGSGKSNFMNMLIFSLLFNEEYIDYIFMIDLKGPELSRYDPIKFITFIDKVDEVATLFEDLKQIMNNRFKQMKEDNQLTYQGKPIYVIIDEVGTIGTYHDKKVRDNIFNNMIEIFQKGRASKIILLLFAQKIDSSNIPSNVLANIQSKVLMKTDSDFNINNTIGKKEEIEEITKTKVANFNKGRAILKDGITSDKYLIQVPYLSDKLQNSMIKYFKSYLS